MTMKAFQRTREYVRRNPRVWFFLYLPVYLIWFTILERTVRTGYYVSHMALDDAIPFVPQFVLVYVLWYPYLLVPAAYLYFRDAKAFVRFGMYFVASFSISMLICSVFPNGQDLRPADPGEGALSWMVGRIYAVDTNTNVLPSMHVVGCAGVCFAAFDTKKFHWVRGLLVILGILICASTVLIKQHSFLDVIWGAVIAAAVGFAVYCAPNLLKFGTNRPIRAS